MFLEDLGKDDGFCVNVAMTNYRTKQNLSVVWGKL